LRSHFRGLLALALWLTPLTGLAQSRAADSSPTVLAPGDVLRITVWRKPEFSGEFLVAPDGSITHPLYRELKVAGIPFSAVDERVRVFLARFEANPAFVLAPLLRVVVGGEVRQPNVYTVPPGTTVAQVIAMAGGPTERGRLDRVRVARGRSIHVVDLTRVDADASYSEVRSGDQVIVERTRNVLRDYLGPASSVVGALAALTSIVIQVTR
jgi:protein involved in polysaccharide export with SLBB domain